MQDCKRFNDGTRYASECNGFTRAFVKYVSNTIGWAFVKTNGIGAKLIPENEINQKN